MRFPPFALLLALPQDTPSAPAQEAEGPSILGRIAFGGLVVLSVALLWMLIRHRRSVATGLRTAGELLHNLWTGPYWWLVPVVAIMLPAAVLFVFLQAAPLVAPFVYTVL